MYYTVRYRAYDTTIDIFHEIRKNNYQHVATLGVGGVDWMPMSAMQVTHIAVRKEYENQGLGRQLYKLYFDNVDRPLVTGDSQTPGGRRMWQKLWQDPEVEVVGLIGIDDADFDLWDEKLQFQKWIDGLMEIGGEYLGHKSFHWFQVPLRQMRRQMSILKHFKLYPSARESMHLPITHMMARKRGTR